MKLNAMRCIYVTALELKNQNLIDEIITPQFWGQYARNFTTYILKWRNSNAFDTPNYFSMKPSEQAYLEADFMDKILTNEIKLSRFPKASKEKYEETLRKC